jgi:DNA polymerase, archaea type
MLYILSATYDVKLNALILKLYNDITDKIEEWGDSQYKAYFLSKEKVKDIDNIYSQEHIVKYDALHDKNVNLWKVEMETPSDIKQTESMIDVHENQIMFFLSYIYDNNIKMGMPYVREGSKIVFKEDPEVAKRIDIILAQFKLTDEERENYKMWAELMEYSAPNFKRAAVDIEVWNDVENKIAIPEQALNPVTAICFVNNKGERIALVLIREGFKFEGIPPNIDRMEFFSNEKDLLLRTYALINENPIILTFNGDDFDLPYLYYRGIRFDINKSNIPISIRSKVAMLNNSIHIDLHKFLSIKAMKTYAFANKYKDVGLDEVSIALLGRGKIKYNKKFNDLTYYELSNYCMEDSQLTLDLTTYDDNVVMNLILMIQRISRLPIENSSRKNVGTWIKNFMTYEHRRKNYLIPTASEIKLLKGGTESLALIKGKKYKGAIVFEPKGGIHFNVLVLDFASLYPSIIKNYNIGYATVNCPHEECKSNTVGELKHWMCKKNKSMESKLIGSLRDLRVSTYKKKAKDKSLPKAVQAWYKVAEQSIKVIMNASYGVFGDDKFVFYCPPSAEEIAAIARFITSSTAIHATELGLEVIYGDTDSIFIKNPNMEKLNELIAWTKEKFGIEFEIDKRYRYTCLSGRKKNYFGVKEDGDVDVKGLTGKKKHTPHIIKDAFDETKKILSDIKTEEDVEEGKIKIVKVLKSVFETIKKRQWTDIKNIAFNVTMSKESTEYTSNVPQHVRAAKMLEEKGYTITANTNVSFVKILRKETVFSKTGKKSVKMVSDIKPVELAQREEVDIDKYTEFFKATFAQILEPMGVDFDKEVLGIMKIQDWCTNT